MGITDLADTSNAALQMKEVVTVEAHENFAGSYDWDIAVLTLTAPFLETIYVRPVGLANFFDGLAGQQCQLTGWGLVARNPDMESTSLHKADFKVMSHPWCTIKWWILSFQLLVDHRELCAETYDGGACFGDSGGPLTCNGRLAGVVSWGSGDCTPGVPNVYTRIHYHTGWIRQRLI